MSEKEAIEMRATMGLKGKDSLCVYPREKREGRKTKHVLHLTVAGERKQISRHSFVAMNSYQVTSYLIRSSYDICMHFILLRGLMILYVNIIVAIYFKLHDSKTKPKIKVGLIRIFHSKSHSFWVRLLITYINMFCRNPMTLFGCT